jgi:hypothetical protein
LLFIVGSEQRATECLYGDWVHRDGVSHLTVFIELKIILFVLKISMAERLILIHYEKCAPSNIAIPKTVD